MRKQQGKLRYGLNYTFSHDLGIMGAGRTGVSSDIFHLRNNYREPGFDRRHVFNANYSYDFGKVVKNRWAGIVANNWELSGITSFQSGAPLQSAMYSPNFGLNGTMNVPEGSFGVGPTILLGTPDVTLQPTLSCNPAVHNKQLHEYMNGACFGLNPTLGENGIYRFPRITGPAYADSDLTAAKTFKVTDKTNLQFRFASFNFLNHANTTFDNIQETAYSLNFNNTFASTSLPVDLASAKGQNANFGMAPLRTGRRISEMSVKYNF